MLLDDRKLGSEFSVIYFDCILYKIITKFPVPRLLAYIFDILMINARTYTLTTQTNNSEKEIVLELPVPYYKIINKHVSFKHHGLSKVCNFCVRKDSGWLKGR